MSTALGLLALLFWSTTIAFSRSLAEQLGSLTVGAIIFTSGGILGFLAEIIRKRRFPSPWRLPANYLFGCGGLFVLYMVTLYLAVGLAVDRRQAVEVGIINYLWPGLTLLFSIPILGKRARAALIPGAAIALAGIVLATTQGVENPWGVFKENLLTNGLPYFFALIAAFSWALYSNLVRRWGGDEDENAAPLFLIISGAVLFVLSLFVHQGAAWTQPLRGALELVYMAIFPTFLAYTFWDVAMRKGRIILIVSVSYLTPLVSTVISSIYLKVPLGLRLWAACALVIAGAAVCKISVVEEGESGRMKDKG